jgi:hypothetical protein
VISSPPSGSVSRQKPGIEETPGFRAACDGFRVNYQSQPRTNSAMMMMGSGNPNNHAAKAYLIFPDLGASLFTLETENWEGRFMASFRTD